jgi:hypothetical protein
VQHGSVSRYDRDVISLEGRDSGGDEMYDCRDLRGADGSSGMQTKDD